jgi:hypothetical protein
LWAEDGNAGVGAAEFEGPHGGNGHDGVSEPVWRANDDAEGCGIGFVGRQVDTPFGFIDEEVRKAGYDGISKVVIYEPKSPQNNLISFLTLGLFLPRSYVISGYVSDSTLPAELPDTAPKSNPKIKN